MVSAEYNNLCDHLVKAGVPAKTTINIKGRAFTLDDPISILTSTPISARPFEELLIEYGRQITLTNELEAIVRVLTERGLKLAGPFIVSIFRNKRYHEDQSLLWVAGNALSVIKDPSTYSDIVDLCRDSSLGTARQMLFTALPWTKVDGALEVAIAAINDDGVRAHAIEALGRFRKPGIIPLLEKLVLDKKKYEWKARDTAVRRLRRVAAKASPAG